MLYFHFEGHTLFVAGNLYGKHFYECWINTLNGVSREFPNISRFIFRACSSAVLTVLCHVVRVDAMGYHF